MRKTRGALLLVVGLMVAAAQAQVPCPGYNPNRNVNLACEIVTVTGFGYNTQTTQNLAAFAPTLATELSQLPIATAVSGSGLAFKGGIPTVSTDSLGTILTQRGETLGKHKFFVAFNYQRFDFGTVDGQSLKTLPIVNVIAPTYATFTTRVDLKIDQFTALGSYGLTDKIDLSVIVPFSKVTLASSRSDVTVYSNNTSTLINNSSLFLPGSASGIGDVTANLKVNVLKQERSSIAIGGEVRFPTGDETNYLGTGAYGVKPYFIFSRRGRITPNVNVGYQWNGASSLNMNTLTGAKMNLPSSFLYSGGVDFLVVKHLTLNAEFLGQYIVNGPRIGLAPPPGGSSAPSAIQNQQFVAPLTGSYAMDNAGVGFKLNLFKGLLITANALFQLDDPGLRSKVVPLVGISYKF